MASDQQGAAQAESIPRSASEALRKLKSGEFSLDDYLDYRADEAVLHLQRTGFLKPDQVEFIREMLREQLTTDPVLVELVRRATGQTPEPASAG
jgi:hypothetical protein